MPTEMDPIADLVKRLNGTKKLRVWSVIITFFGDAIVPRGGSVSARTVQLLLARMGIEAGAVRTAFSRLTSDGWVVREKVGRSSYFQLSPAGLAPFEEATDRIYAPLLTTNPEGKGWRLLIREDSYPEPVILPSASIDQDDDCFVLEGQITRVPAWMKELRCQPDHKHSFNALMQSFAPLDRLELAPLDALAARCLLIHEWRRILFQFEDVAPEFWADDWPQAECHRFVCGLYHDWLQASETWMNEEARGLEGRLALPKSNLEGRFN